MLNCKPVDGGVDSVVGVGIVGAVDGVDNSTLGDVPTGVDAVDTGGVVGTVERKSYIFFSNIKRMLLKTISDNSQELQVVNSVNTFTCMSSLQISRLFNY